MESPNVALIRRIWELFNGLPLDEDERWASPEFEELEHLFDPEVEFVQPEQQVDAGSFRGRRALFDAWNDWLNLWERHRSEITGIEEGSDKVLVFSHETFSGRDGLELERDTWAIFTLSNGRVARFDAFFDEESARAAFEPPAPA